MSSMKLGTHPWLVVSAGILSFASIQSDPTLQRDPVGDDTLRLTASWEGMTSSNYGLYERLPALAPVVHPQPSERVHAYERAFFDRLLPTDELEVGAVWELDAQGLVPLLAQLHTGARMPVQRASTGDGARALLLARSERWIDVLFRLHGEFALNEDAYLTVSQFEGRAIFDRERGVHSFSLRVPPRDVNATVHAKDATNGAWAADIGFIPRMELEGGAPVPDELTLDETALEAARLKLRRAFYRFTEIEWLPLAEALRRARAEAKPIHAVILIGTLDDEAC